MQIHHFGVAAISLALVSGCSDNACGIGGAPASGLVANGTGVTLTFGALTSGQHHDCPSLDGSTVESITISTPSGADPILTLCVARPDELDSGQPLDTIMGTGVQVVDAGGTNSGCMYSFPSSGTVSGTAKSDGLCSAGTDPAGFALTLDGTAMLQQKCGTTIDTVMVTLAGRVAVTPL